MQIGTLFIISAPSGAGKTSLVAALLAQEPFKDVLTCVVTYTTRSPRHGDVNGRDYHFIQDSEFVGLVEKGFFAEWSMTYGAYYGTPASTLQALAQGRSQILILDRLGAERMSKMVPGAVLIWITPPSIEILEARLRVRGTENEAQIQRRLGIARVEIEGEIKNPLYAHHIINDLFENSLNSLKKIVIFALELKK